MTDVLPANTASFDLSDDARSFQKRMDVMWSRVNDLFALQQRPSKPSYDPIFDDPMQVKSMISYFDKKQQKTGFGSDSGFLSVPALIDAMAAHFTDHFENNDLDGRHKLNVIKQELAKEDVRRSLARVAYNADRVPNPLEDALDEVSARISSITSPIALGFNTHVTPVISNIAKAVRDLKSQGPSKDQLEILKYGNVVPTITTLAGSPEVVKAKPAPEPENASSSFTSSVSKMAMGFNNFIKPKITNFSQAVRDFSFKSFAQNKANDVMNAGRALKQSYDNDKVGTLKSVACGVGTGIALKMAFNTAATATGVGLVATVGYGLTKTFKEEYDKSKRSGNGVWQALKDAGNTKVDLALLKRSAKHSAFFGLGFGLGLGVGAGIDSSIESNATEVVPEATEKPPVEPIIDPLEEKAPVEKAPLSEPILPEDPIFKEDMPQFVETVPDVELTEMQQRLAGIEGMTPEVLETLKDASPQDVKDMAVSQLWSKDGDQALGARLMEEAAKMGNKQAINDVVALRDMGILEQEASVDAQIAETTIPESISQRMASDNPRVVMQAKNDLAVAMLNGKEFMDLGVEKNFPLGVTTLDELASAGHEKSLRDLDTLVHYGMVSQDNLSVETQMKLVLQDGALAACSRSLDTCSFSESAIDDAVAQSSDSKITNFSLKEAISKGFNMLQTGDRDVVPFNKAQTTGLVASIK
ncbi:MAG: hypothetical protein ACPG05_04570 [Bdellovibrionales bacterium]